MGGVKIDLRMQNFSFASDAELIRVATDNQMFNCRVRNDYAHENLGQKNLLVLKIY